ncbi:MAG TPA: bifunctional diguanylate cyclase/phosphodiesterase, partial [Azospira sp.]|nr:bifunctional diguanylate cyclase/phosphodiesterase [Azospira sp.]
QGVILLLGPVRPAGRLSLPELFSPILERLGRSLTLCYSYEQEVVHRVERTAYYDPLTGLPNAVLFNNTLQQSVLLARAKGRWLALVHVDMDDFRGFNEAHGEVLGNQALVALGQRLSAQCRPGELLARIGGDEFMLLLPDLGGWDDVDERIVRILQTNRTPLEVDGQSLDVTFSAGIALLPSDSDNGDTLVRHAQMALHQAKQEGRGHFRLFDAEQDRRTHSRREILRRLELALANREFRLYYQPKVDMPTGKVLGFEALLRWFHPDRGMVPPGEFLPTVENSDFIIQLGEWVMREALAQAVSWRIAGLETCISVNIAGRHLQLPDFAERVRQALADVPGGRPDSLEIEILESSILEDMAHVREVMRACAAQGVRFALDDFGTGYSSLAYLHQLPAATIKIDQLFVRNLFQQREDPAIIQAVVQIAEVFGRHLVAEGVEDPEHGMLLMCIGCRTGQGYGIGRPMAAEAVLPWVASYKPLPEWLALQGLGWHPGLYELLHLRYNQRHWHLQLEEYLAESHHGDPLPEPDHCALADWLTIAAPVGSSRLAQKGFRLVGSLITLTRQLGIARTQEEAAACASLRSQLLTDSHALIAILDDLAHQLVSRSNS